MAATVVQPNNKSVAFGGKAEKVGKLPKHVPKGAKKMAKQGLISPKQMQRMREG